MGLCNLCVCCLSDENWSLGALFDSGFLDYMTHLVYLIIVPDGLFVSESSVSQLQFYHP